MPVQDAMIAAVRLCVGDPSADVHWAQRESGYRAATNYRLEYVSQPKRGRDEVRYSAPDASGDMAERVYGVRRAAIQIKIETSDQDLAESAHDLADTIRAGMMASDVLEILNAAGLGGPQPQDPRSMDYRDAHGRWRSAVVLEVWFNTWKVRTGPAIPAIAGVEVTGPPGSVFVDDGSLGLHGTSAGAASALGVLSVSGVDVLVGASTGLASVTGALARSRALGGALSGSAVPSGSLGAFVALGGASAGVASEAGALGAFVALSGTSVGSADALGELAPDTFAGSIAGTSDASGTLGAFVALGGASTGIATEAGALGAFVALGGTSTGIATEAGALGAFVALSGTSAGSASEAADLTAGADTAITTETDVALTTESDDIITVE